MFTKRDRVFVRNVDPAQVTQILQGTLQSYGFAPAAPGVPNSIIAVGPPLEYGIIPKVSLNIYQAEGGHVVDIDVRSEFDQSKLVLAILLFMFLWFVALILGFLAYQSFERYAQYLIGALKQPLTPYAVAPAPWPGQPPGH